MGKKYRISEISEMLNISKEMIRYYEKCGVINPIRSQENNYRVYSEKDIFVLIEMMQLKELEIPVKEFAEIKYSNYSERVVELFHNAYENTIKEIKKKQMICSRIKEISERVKTASYNMNQYWVKEIPERRAFHLVTSEREEYSSIKLPHSISKQIFGSNMAAYVDPEVTFQGITENWWLTITEEYFNELNMTVQADALFPKKLCMCTIIDMGEFGTFNQSCADELLKHITESGYQLDGMISGAILTRELEKTHVKRLLELRVPIKH